ncbi:MAG: hypothetical protein BroJett039_09370 [Chloroflexota bacterium]|nr:MAG: hypothetical protein BroJett039_09370 [Chloroflexota bacterium]
MLDSAIAAPERAAEIFLDADGNDSEAVWARVETARAAGQRVWLNGALFANLIQRFGVTHDGKKWLALAPRVQQPEWFFRARDILLAGAVLLALAPLFALLALLVKLSSPGPIFYATTVVGAGQRTFVWRKFRSMRVLAQTQDESARREQFRAFARGQHQGKVIDAARVTPLGAFLRKYSLDELPQLWNVLQGDMTLVGPRPCLPYEAEMFPVWATRRFAVPPGLTGVWQVMGRARVPLQEGLAMDVYYSLTRSFGADWQWLWETLRVIRRGEGGK